jgi:hypothetical protein
MSHFLARLLMKSQGAPSAVRPRLPSRFDPAPFGPDAPGLPPEIDAEHDASTSPPMLKTSSTGAIFSAYEGESPKWPAMPVSETLGPAQAARLGPTSTSPRPVTSPRQVDELPAAAVPPDEPAPPLLPVQSRQTTSSAPEPEPFVPPKRELSATTTGPAAEPVESDADDAGPPKNAPPLEPAQPNAPSRPPLQDLEQEVQVESAPKRTNAPAAGPLPPGPPPSEPAPRERHALTPIVGRIAAVSGQEPAREVHTERGLPSAQPAQAPVRSVSLAANRGAPARPKSPPTRVAPAESLEPTQETVVHVAIGRIEVRLAPARPTSDGRSKPATADGVMSLTDYLQERARGGRQ